MACWAHITNHTDTEPLHLTRGGGSPSTSCAEVPSVAWPVWRSGAPQSAGTNLSPGARNWLRYACRAEFALLARSSGGAVGSRAGVGPTCAVVPAITNSIWQHVGIAFAELTRGAGGAVALIVASRAVAESGLWAWSGSSIRCLLWAVMPSRAGSTENCVGEICGARCASEAGRAGVAPSFAAGLRGEPACRAQHSRVRASYAKAASRTYVPSNVAHAGDKGDTLRWPSFGVAQLAEVPGGTGPRHGIQAGTATEGSLVAQLAAGNACTQSLVPVCSCRTEAGKGRAAFAVRAVATGQVCACEHPVATRWHHSSADAVEASSAIGRGGLQALCSTILAGVTRDTVRNAHGTFQRLVCAYRARRGSLHACRSAVASWTAGWGADGPKPSTEGADWAKIALCSAGGVGIAPSRA